MDESHVSVAELPLARFLARCHAEFSRDQSGEVASYIPELALANPSHFGIAVTTVDGFVYEIGDSTVEFTIQSISKAFVFALALETVGAERVEAIVGVEPSGDAFNSIRLGTDPSIQWSTPARSPVPPSSASASRTAPSTGCCRR